MPSATKIKEFIRAVRERKSAIAIKLDAASLKCKTNSSYRNDLHQLIAAWDPNTQPLNSTLGDKLGLTPKEVKHINHWRQVVGLASLHQNALAATDAGLSSAHPDMQFFWEIGCDDNLDSHQTIDGAAPDPITVTFLTPRGNVRKGSLWTQGEIDVDI